MKNSIIKHLLLFGFLLSSVILHATPGDTDGTGNLEGADAPAAPIDNWISLALILGLQLGYYILKTRKKISE
ncbi:MAG: hypothetical protein KA133_11755 [Flavobacterium sp.]|nr:hypothetical protein [Flavobacterium sp.]